MAAIRRPQAFTTSRSAALWPFYWAVKRPASSRLPGIQTARSPTSSGASRYGDPQELARIADWPASQLDLLARTKWLQGQRQRLHRNLIHDPTWFDPACAAWYAWVQSVKIDTNGRTILLGRAAGVRRREALALRSILSH